MRRIWVSMLCIALGFAFSLSTVQAKEGKANAGKKLLNQKLKNVKPFGKKSAKKATKSKKSKKKAKKKAKLFDKIKSKKGKNQKFRNAYSLAVISKLVYQAQRNLKTYRDEKDENRTKKGKIVVGGLVEAARFERFGLELCNPNMPYFVTKKNKKNKTIIDAQAYLLHNDSSVILAFRGSKEKADWTTNGDALVHYELKPVKKYGKKVRVHRGWLNATELVHKQFKLQSEIDKCIKKDGKNRKLLVTGHSLGGAMATLWTYYFRKKNKVQAVELHTFGAPSAGNKQFVKSFKKLSGKKLKAYSWVNQDDPVTGVTWTLGFRRTGQPQWISCKGIGQLCKAKNLILKTKMGGRLAGKGSMHYMTNYIDRVLQLAPKKVRKELKALGAGKTVNKFIGKVYKP